MGNPISSDTEWESFCGVLGNPLWTRDERFAEPVTRWKNQSELDALIEDWTKEHDNYDAMKLLQEAGVTAGAVLDNAEMLSDPHLVERGFFASITQPDVGTHLYPSDYEG